MLSEDEVIEKEEMLEKEQEEIKNAEIFRRGELISQLPENIKDLLLEYLSNLFKDAFESRQVYEPGSKEDYMAYGVLYAVDLICRDIKRDIDKYNIIKESLKKRVI